MSRACASVSGEKASRAPRGRCAAAQANPARLSMPHEARAPESGRGRPRGVAHECWRRRATRCRQRTGVIYRFVRLRPACRAERARPGARPGRRAVSGGLRRTRPRWCRSQRRISDRAVPELGMREGAANRARPQLAKARGRSPLPPPLPPALPAAFPPEPRQKGHGERSAAWSDGAHAQARGGAAQQESATQTHSTHGPQSRGMTWQQTGLCRTSASVKVGIAAPPRPASKSPWPLPAR